VKCDENTSLASEATDLAADRQMVIQAGVWQRTLG